MFSNKRTKSIQQDGIMSFPSAISVQMMRIGKVHASLGTRKNIAMYLMEHSFRTT